MRLLLTILFICITLASVQAQTVLPQGNTTTTFWYRGAMIADSAFRAPFGKLPKIPAWYPTSYQGTPISKNGLLFVDTLKNEFYFYSNGLWRKAGGSSLDTAALYAEINLRVKYTDTATMLSSYIRNAGYGLSKTGQTASVDTALIPTKVGLAASLAGYYPVTGGNITGTGGAGFIGLPAQTTAPTVPTTGMLKVYADASGRLTWLSSLGFTRTLYNSVLTANRLYKFQDKDYTVADSADVVPAARNAISLTTTGSGAATYSNATGVLNVPTAISGLTTNYLTKATSATTIGISQVFDNATSVGIGTITPAANSKLEIVGTAGSSTGVLHVNAATSSSDRMLFSALSSNEGGSMTMTDGAGTGFFPNFNLTSNAISGTGGMIVGVMPVAQDALVAGRAAIMLRTLRVGGAALTAGNVLTIQNGPTTTLGTMDFAGNLGLGGVNSAARLFVQGSSATTGQALILSNSTPTMRFQVNNGGVTPVQMAVLNEYADDAAAGTAGVPIGGLYRTGSAVKQRIN